MPNEAITTSRQPEPSVLEVFEQFIRTREFEQPPEADSFALLLSDDDSKRSFRELVESYTWTQDLLPRNVQPNVVLAGRFRLIERLGVGGMGQVWRAEDQKIGREVAVKVMSLVGSASIDSEAAFERETHLLAQMKHPGIVSVLDSDRDEEHRFLVMDLVEGRSLEDVLDTLKKNAGLAPDCRGRSAADIVDAVGAELAAGHTPLLGREDWCDGVVKVMVETLLTLEAAHARLVVHRDLKPGNLMITPGGQPVLLDFGLGGMIGGPPGDLTSSLFGTFRFVAPEQLSRGTSGTDIRTDIYQLGIVLYEFLTLSKCFGTEDHAELFSMIARGDFVSPRALDKSIPRELEDICLRAIDVNPGLRYQTAMEFREALQRFLRREPVHMDRYGATERFSRSFRYAMRRHRPLVLGLTGVLLAGALAWFARDAIAETVTLAAQEVTPDGNMLFKMTLRKSQFAVGILHWKQADKTWYRATRIEVAAATAIVAKPDPVHFPEGEFLCRAALPKDLVDTDGEWGLTCAFAGDAADFDRLKNTIQQMQVAMAAAREPGVDQEWIDMHWYNVLKSNDESPDLPADEVFDRRGYENGRVTARTMTFRTRRAKKN
jgi:serine/threonine protein kinase